MLNIIGVPALKGLYNKEYFKEFDTILTQDDINFVLKIFIQTDEIERINNKTLKIKFISPSEKHHTTEITIDEYKIYKGIVSHAYDISYKLPFPELGVYTYNIYLDNELVYKNYLESIKKEV